ncbi:outer membrane receptor protein involved in Fe transport [Povalibacter uvarum]|uniref:Outer membrane receptor protein involved in Fe transport n=1 Tax=Povalibacter uvarum TaxID=732238 RepID=A0A841HU00_9GAMM|nr:TonB-dependent receptor [Povalibacter uvarum]MBB6095325.1 outer membrane receptor protein involved in Fe transport [Povalibacter uvarum]
MRYRVATGCGAVLLATSSAVLGGGIPTSVLEEVTVVGQLARLNGSPVSASQGVVTSEQLELRPTLRTGEMLEVVPGLIVTQHSGDGKANQYFLRGFNLDHGTDLATSVDGVPVNMPTHGHGQGYTDINFVIPELVESVAYRKGTYYAETGNFSAAGAVDLRYRKKVDGALAVFEGGENDFMRGLFAASPEVGPGVLLVGLEYAHIDGPWVLEENFEKINGLVRYTQPLATGQFSVTAQGYDGDWRSTDQIPQRAVDSGQIDRFGFVDPTDAGASHRYGLSVDWDGAVAGGTLSALAYAVDYRLNLFSNFSYFIDQENGDQFEQFDDRRIYGTDIAWRNGFELAGRPQELLLGVQVRSDDIDKVGLYRTIARERFQTIREDSVTQTSYSAYASIDTRWSDLVRTTIGLRGDAFEFGVDASLLENAGSASDSIVSPKFAMVIGPWRQTELFLDVGKGFHSNDARGTTITVDPADGVTPADRVDPLVDALGADIGIRTAIIPTMQLSVSVWSLDLDSELLFVGDAGTTEASRASERRGVELAAIWNPVSWLIVDADLAWSRARFTDDDPAGDRIPGAIENVASLGVAIDHPSGWFGGARFRHFGEAPLIEDNSVRSSPTTLVNLEAGYRFSNRWRVSAGLYNVFDSKDNDITYFYESQLANETEPVEDIHFHPVEPRTVRVRVGTAF